MGEVTWSEDDAVETIETGDPDDFRQRLRKAILRDEIEAEEHVDQDGKIERRFRRIDCLDWYIKNVGTSLRPRSLYWRWIFHNVRKSTVRPATIRNARSTWSEWNLLDDKFQLICLHLALLPEGEGLIKARGSHETDGLAEITGIGLTTLGRRLRKLMNKGIVGNLSEFSGHSGGYYLIRRDIVPPGELQHLCEELEENKKNEENKETSLSEEVAADVKQQLGRNSRDPF